MVDLLERDGKLLEAEELIKKMVWKADVVILGALLAGCRKHGNCEIAARLVKTILHLEPHNHMVGRWDDVFGTEEGDETKECQENPWTEPSR